MSIADTVNTWFSERLANGPLARSTEAYNQAVAALPDLIARLSPADAPATDLAPADPAASGDAAAASDGTGTGKAKA